MEKFLFIKRAAIAFVITFVFVNIAVIDFIIISKRNTPAFLSVPESVGKNSNPSQTLTAPNSCPLSCITEIKNATSSGLKLNTVSSSESSQTLSKTSASSAANLPAPKEFFIPIGTGNTSAGDWTDIPGAEVAINSAYYSNIKSVVFEAAVHIPTGNETAYVRLFNATDQHPVWFSDVSISGGTPQLLFSNPITLDPGIKTYQVQMKTSLLYTAVLDLARIHITTY